MPEGTVSPSAWLRRDGVITLIALVLILCWDFSGLDLAVARQWGSPQGFPLSTNVWTKTILHEGGRDLGWALLALVCIGAWRGGCGASPTRWRNALLTMLGCVLLISILKSRSLTSCPWSLAEFGGTAHYVSHWLWGEKDGGSGHCFPSGHASTGFASFSLHFLWRDIRPRWSCLSAGAVCLAGLIFGVAQILRGAHYPSHTLWTGWICWTMTALAYHRLWRDSRSAGDRTIASSRDQ